MPYCPDCKEEYRQEIKTCPTCDVALVDSVLDEGDQVAELAVACTVIQEDKAHIIRGFLESEGVACQLENISFHMEPIPAGELTKVRLWTRKEDVEQARNLIRQHEELDICSACGHVVEDRDSVCDFCGADLKAG